MVEDGFEVGDKGLYGKLDVELEAGIDLMEGSFMRGIVVNILSGLVPFGMESVLSRNNINIGLSNMLLFH